MEISLRMEPDRLETGGEWLLVRGDSFAGEIMEAIAVLPSQSGLVNDLVL